MCLTGKMGNSTLRHAANHAHLTMHSSYQLTTHSSSEIPSATCVAEEDMGLSCPHICMPLTGCRVIKCIDCLYFRAAACRQAELDQPVVFRWHILPPFEHASLNFTWSHLG